MRGRTRPISLAELGLTIRFGRISSTGAFAQAEGCRSRVGPTLPGRPAKRKSIRDMAGTAGPTHVAAARPDA